MGLLRAVPSHVSNQDTSVRLFIFQEITWQKGNVPADSLAVRRIERTLAAFMPFAWEFAAERRFDAVSSNYLGSNLSMNQSAT